jgi:hypothetical protein
MGSWTLLFQFVCVRHVEIAQYADKRAPIQNLLIGYLEAYLDRLKRWLRDWRIAINVSKSTAVPFVNEARLIQEPSQNCPGSRRANTLGRNSTVSWGDQ